MLMCCAVLSYGLSYTTFEYSDLKVSYTTHPCDPIGVTVTVKNTGTVDSDEVVQVYIKQPHASVPVPQVRLAAFKRVHVPKAGSLTVTLSVMPDAHAVVTSDEGGEAIYFASKDQKVEKGQIMLHVGGGQPDYYEGSLSIAAVVGAEAALSTCDK